MIISCLAGGVFGILYTKCKRTYCSAVEEDEVVLDQIDNRLNYILLISSIAMVCSFFVIGCLVPLAESFSLANYFTVLLSFVIALISCLIVQYKVVDLGKKMNPNKKVSIFDLNFAVVHGTTWITPECLQHLSFDTTIQYLVPHWILPFSIPGFPKSQ